MDGGRKKTYPSKRDWWLAGIIWIALAAMLVGLVGMMTTPDPLLVRLGGAALTLAGIAFTLWIYYSTRYTLTDTELIVRTGPLRWRVALDSIDEVSPSRNPISSPAFSLDRRLSRAVLPSQRATRASTARLLGR
jgi:hypothetical protein